MLREHSCKFHCKCWVKPGYQGVLPSETLLSIAIILHEKSIWFIQGLWSNEITHYLSGTTVVCNCKFCFLCLSTWFYSWKTRDCNLIIFRVCVCCFSNSIFINVKLISVCSILPIQFSVVFCDFDVLCLVWFVLIRVLLGFLFSFIGFCPSCFYILNSFFLKRFGLLSKEAILFIS